MKVVILGALIGLLLGAACFAMIDIYGMPKQQLSCKERGGKIVTGSTMPMWVGKIMILMPQTRCKF